MLTDKERLEICAAEMVTEQLAAKYGVKPSQLYRIRREMAKTGAAKIVDQRFKADAERVLRYDADANGCWNWTGHVGAGGYGRLGAIFGETQAHRASFIYHKGPIPAGLSILHSCDNRRCINPKHLSPGTYSENQQQAYDRGRRPRLAGEANPYAKLTQKQVDAIRLDQRTQAVIAKSYDVSTSLVSAIKCGKAWRTQESTKRAQMNLR